MTIRINLLPVRELRERRRKRRALVAGIAALCLTAAALAAVNVSQLRRRAALEARLAERQRVAAGLETRAQPVRELAAWIRRQRQWNRAADAWRRRGRVLRALANAAPERLWLTRYSESDGVTTLEGRADGNEPIARFLRSLSPVLGSARLVEAGTADEEPGLIRFVIRAAPDAPPPAAP